MMMTLEQIRTALADRNIQAVAKATGIHRETIYKLAKDQGQPLYITAKKLSDYLQREIRES